ncbi:hypothetical protein P4C99_21895 [Pontiellaceae bacterium B1224]|nr:hypothetical protein [Pontiellaceae bacterium B1224]
MNQQLQEIIETGEFEDNGSCQIQSLNWVEEDLHVELYVRTGFEDEQAQYWNVIAHTVRAQKIEKEWDDILEEVTEHPVLLPYTSNTANLFFSHFESSKIELLGNLYMATYEFVGDWLNLNSYLNYSAITIEGSSGCLAKGPAPLLEIYKKEVEKLGGKANLLSVMKPKRWDGEKWIEEYPDLKALILGASYIIARDFTYKKHNQNMEPTVKTPVE